MRWGIDQAEARARIRYLRSHPPGKASTNARKPTFDAALEQFDELLEAGNGIGAAASPIPYFYSLSQAGRALSAAFVHEADWEIAGHGLKFTLANGSPIGDGLIKPDPGKSDAFSLMSRVVGSDPLSADVPLQQAWAAAPYMWAPEALGKGNAVPLQLTGETNQHPHVVARLDGEVVRGVKDDGDRTQEVRKRLEKYPKAADLEVRGISRVLPADVPISYLAWPEADNGDRPIRDFAPQMIKDGAYYLQPGLGRNDDAINPIMVWWLVLFALSSLARYHPASWMAALDPAKSASAVPIEQALREWSQMGPTAILHELERER